MPSDNSDGHLPTTELNTLPALASLDMNADSIRQGHTKDHDLRPITEFLSLDALPKMQKLDGSVLLQQSWWMEFYFILVSQKQNEPKSCLSIS